MELEQYIQHPEQLDRNTLFDLRNLVAQYPYHQVARILMLQNLYLLHDSTFDEELRRSAFYITDRTTLFNLVEAVHYRLISPETKKRSERGIPEEVPENEDNDRTGMLIDIFLDSIPPEEPEKPAHAPTPIDATRDYMAYLLETEQAEGEHSNCQDFSHDNSSQEVTLEPAPQPIAIEDDAKANGFSIIDNFLENEGGKIEVDLDDSAPYIPERDIPLADDYEEVEEDYFTETLAKIYIKQGRYSKAFEIIQRLNLNNPKKNAYFADQMRFLEKIIANEKSRKKS